LFFAPIAIKAAIWLQVARLEAPARRVVDSVHNFASMLQVSQDLIVGSLGRELDNLLAHGPCFDGVCHTVSVVALLLGLDIDWYDGTWEARIGALAGSLLIVYNVARLTLTWFVAPLRDEEARSAHVPRRGLRDLRPRLPRHAGTAPEALFRRFRTCYGWMSNVQKLVFWLGFLAYASTAVTIWNFATATLVLP
jgi:hypothetical protein